MNQANNQATQVLQTGGQASLIRLSQSDDEQGGTGARCGATRETDR